MPNTKRKPKIDAKLKDAVDYYRENKKFIISLPIAKVKMFSNPFKMEKFLKSQDYTIEEFFGEAWQELREIIIPESHEVYCGKTITDESGSLQIVDITDTDTNQSYSYLFLFEHGLESESYYNISMAKYIINQKDNIKNTSSILEVLSFPNWEDHASEELASVIKNQNQWWRLKNGYGLTMLLTTLRKNQTDEEL